MERLVALGLNERPVPYKCSCTLPDEMTSFELWIHCLYSDHTKHDICTDCNTVSPHFTTHVHVMSDCGY